MSNLPADDADELEIKKRARRRLVGAVALALLAVILLPLAMDGGSPPIESDVQVSVPSRDASPRTAVDADADAGKVEIEPDTVMPGQAESLPPAPPPVIPDPPPPVASVPPAAQIPAVAQTLPAPPPPATQTSPPAQSAHGTDAAPRDDEAARALALLNGETSASSSKGENRSKNKGKVYIQAASFGDAARAAALAAELKKQGFAAYAEKAGKVNRVRIGPLARADAEHVAARLKAKGHGALLLSR
ncbi:MAG: SPOR domain-containing protein [Azoarcus sp.]|nr:SPOR domain-containing protein [Azoarcus sp.]